MSTSDATADATAATAATTPTPPPTLHALATTWRPKDEATLVTLIDKILNLSCTPTTSPEITSDLYLACTTLLSHPAHHVHGVIRMILRFKALDAIKGAGTARLPEMRQLLNLGKACYEGIKNDQGRNMKVEGMSKEREAIVAELTGIELCEEEEKEKKKAEKRKGDEGGKKSKKGKKRKK